MRGWKEEAETGPWSATEQEVIVACGRAMAGLGDKSVDVAIRDVEFVIEANHGKGELGLKRQLRLMRKLAEHELMEPQLHGKHSSRESDRHGLAESSNAAQLGYVSHNKTLMHASCRQPCLPDPSVKGSLGKLLGTYMLNM